MFSLNSVHDFVSLAVLTSQLRTNTYRNKVETRPGQHVDHVLEIQLVTDAMKNYKITERDMKDLIEVVNSKHNLKALPARDNLRKGQHIKRAIKDRSCTRDDKEAQKRSLRTALQAQQHLLRQKDLMKGKSKTAKNVIKTAGKNIDRMLKK